MFSCLSGIVDYRLARLISYSEVLPVNITEILFSTFLFLTFSHWLFFLLLKTHATLKKKVCVVYQVLCSDCNFVYIGLTKRDLKSRLAEHKLAIKNQELEKSALCKHSTRFDHSIDWNNSKIWKTEALYSKRFSSELDLLILIHML